MTEKELKKIYDGKRQKIEKKSGKIIAGFNDTPFDDFKIWFKQDVFDQGCYYCKTTNNQSFELYQLQRTGKRYDATRGGKRSKRLELDRKDPSLPYDNLENIAWCCYWCNNAKSNFFTEEEFRPIADAIGKVLNDIKHK